MTDRVIRDTGASDTLPPGSFLAPNRKVRSQPGWTAYEARYPPAFACDRHDHERAALCMVLSGSYEEGDRKDFTTVPPGALVQHPAGNHHADRHHDQAVNLLIIEFEPDYLLHLRGHSPVLGERVVYADRTGISLAQRFRREVLAQDAAAPLACEAILLECLARLARLSHPSRDTAPSWVRRVEERLHDFSDATISLSSLAADVDLHPMHLTRAFRKHRGSSIGSYRRKIMVEEVARLLLETRDDLANIALSTGFADQSHMSRTFKASYGIAPSRFRRGE